MLNQGHLEPISQDCDKTALEYHHRWRLHSLPGNSYQCSVTLTAQKNNSWYSDEALSVSALCLLSCHQAPLTRAWLPLLCTLPSGFCIHWPDSASLPPSQGRKSPSSHSPSPYMSHSSLLIIFVALYWVYSNISMFLSYSGAQNWTQQCWAKGTSHLPQPAGNTPHTALYTISLLCSKDPLLLMVKLVPTRTPDPFLQCCFHPVSPKHALVHRIMPPRAQYFASLPVEVHDTPVSSPSGQQHSSVVHQLFIVPEWGKEDRLEIMPGSRQSIKIHTMKQVQGRVGKPISRLRCGSVGPQPEPGSSPA